MIDPAHQGTPDARGIAPTREPGTCFVTPGAGGCAWVSRIAYVSLFLAVALLCCHQIIDVDIGWHLKAAELIIQNSHVPETDDFSYTSAGREWIDLHWLYQLVTYGVYTAFGVPGLALLRMAVILSTFLLLALIASRNFSSPIFAGAMLIGVLAFERYFPRPETFTYLLVAAYLLILHRHYQRGGRVLWLLPLLQVLWTNVEGLFILGLVLVGAFIAGEIAEHILAPGGHMRKPLRAILVVGLLCVMATALNPYGVRGMMFPFVLYTRLGGGREIFSSTITELMPPPLALFTELHWPLWFFNALIALTVVSVMLAIRRPLCPWLFACGAFLFLAIRARRNIPLFVCTAVPLTAMNLHFAAHVIVTRCRWLAIHKRRIAHSLAVVITLLSLGLAASVVTGHYCARYLPLAQPGIGFSYYMYPREAFDFVCRENLSGPMFNNIGIGGYLIWKGYPRRRVFIDGRLEVHGRAFYTEYIVSMRHPERWNTVAQKYGVEYAILQHTMSDTLPLLAVLQKSADWTLVYYDDVSVVFVRKSGRNAAVARKYGPLIEQRLLAAERAPLEPPSRAPHGRMGPNLPFREVHLGTLYATLGLYRAALDQYARALQQNPGLFQTLFNISLVYTLQGENTRALDYAKAALRSRPHSARALDHYAILLMRLQRYAEAEKVLRRAVRFEPHYLKAYYDLALCYREWGRHEAAANTLRRACRRYPTAPQLHRLLALCLAETGALGEALAHAEAARDIDPLDPEAWRLIGHIRGQLGDWVAAKQAYWDGLQQIPYDASLWINLGACQARLGEYSAARASWMKALELQPTNEGVRYNLARLRALVASKNAESAQQPTNQ